MHSVRVHLDVMSDDNTRKGDHAHTSAVRKQKENDHSSFAHTTSSDSIALHFCIFGSESSPFEVLNVD